LGLSGDYKTYWKRKEVKEGVNWFRPKWLY